MRPCYSLLLYLLLLTTGVLTAQSTTVIATGTARLSGQQEALPVLTSGTGSVTVTFEDVDAEEDDHRLIVTGSFSGLSSPLATNVGGGAHIHIALPGRNGSVIQPLSVDLAEDGLSGTFTAEDNTFLIEVERADDLLAGRMYVNIHSERYPSGELRGNVVVAGREAYYTNLLGSNQVQPVVSTAYGALLLQLDTEDNTLTVSGSFRDLGDTLATSIGGGAHLHLGLPGQNGAVDIPLSATTGDEGEEDDDDSDDDRRSGTFRTDDNTFTLTNEQVTALRAGRYYANIHSGAYPSGEIRGQVLPPADAVFRAYLAGANEYPPVSSNASGQALAHVTGTTVRVIGSFNDLSTAVATSIGGGAHLHSGYAGQNGGILQGLSLDLADDSLSASMMIADNTYELTAIQAAQLFDRGVYVNVHSMMHPAGEIRGQVLPESQAVFTAFLNGNQHIPAVTTTGHGMLKVELMGDMMTASGSFSELSSDLNTAIAGGAHLHAGYPGQSGPVIHSLTVSDTMGDARMGIFLPDSNMFELGEMPDTLLRRFFYANIHTLDHPSGEIRGAVLAEAERYFYAPLGGASQPEGVATDATGMVATEVTDSMVTMVGSFQELSSDFAENIGGGMHLHLALAGSNGPVQYPLATEIDEDERGGILLADSNMLTLQPFEVNALEDRKLYANIHTDDYPAGEIRGQLLPAATSYFHTTLSGYNETNAVITTAQGGLKLELNDSNLVVTGSVTMLEGTFDFNPAGGAHLHLAPAGQNGGVVLPLNGDTLMAGMTVEFIADSNRYVLPDSLVTAMRAGRLYANIHTTEVRSGEARGQIRQELNLFPDSSMIVSPMDGDSLTLEGSNQQEFRVSYMPSTDPDGDTVIYVWQLAMDENFDTILFAANTGRDTFFSTNFGTVDVLLDSFGVDTNATATLYHRVLASDGSNFTPSEGASITLTRDSIVSNRNFLPEGFAGRTFPNPTTSNATLTYELTTQEAFRGRILLYNQLGQLRQNLVVNARPGTQQITLNSENLSAGYYFLTLRHDDGRMIQVTRIAVR